jgi:K(+)-stimulated pyrophosphate-energized sodium pump
LSIVQKSGTGHGTNVIGGLAMGMESTVLPILILAAGIWGSFTWPACTVWPSPLRA